MMLLIISRPVTSASEQVVVRPSAAPRTKSSLFDITVIADCRRAKEARSALSSLFTGGTVLLLVYSTTKVSYWYLVLARHYQVQVQWVRTSRSFLLFRARMMMKVK